jgi:hypothetical protein
VKVSTNCLQIYDCMLMSEVKRDQILSSGPARFQRLTAFHPTITMRQVSNLRDKLATSFPPQLFNVICRLEVVYAHLTNHLPFDSQYLPKTREMMAFCKSLCNVYQVFFFIFPSANQSSFLFCVGFFTQCSLSPYF